MTHVVTAPCLGCKTQQCAQVCPCDSFHEGPHMLFIDPDKCIDCGACVPECPVDAIYPDEEVPEDWNEFIDTNVKGARDSPQIVT